VSLSVLCVDPHGLDFNDFETMESSIREMVYLFYKNIKKNMKRQQLASRPFSYKS